MPHSGNNLNWRVYGQQREAGHSAGGVAQYQELCTSRGSEPELLRIIGKESKQKGTNSLSSRQIGQRSEEHTSELQSLAYLVCRLLLEKKKKKKNKEINNNTID